MKPHKHQTAKGPCRLVHDATVRACDGTTYRAVLRQELKAGEIAEYLVCEGRTLKVEPL